MNEFIRITSDRVTLSPSSRRMATITGGFGLLALAIGFVSAQLSRNGIAHYLHSYLLGFVFVVSLSQGALFFVVLHHLTRAGWSVVLRRLAEALAVTLPGLLIMFLPILVGMLAGNGSLYEWNNQEVVRTDALVRGKVAYLNAPFFALRCLFYFAVWGGLAFFFWSHSARQDESGDTRLTLQMQKWSGPAMMAFAVTVTFAAFDWLMSLDPHWFSTIYAVYFFSGGVVGFFALITLVATVLQRFGYLRESITSEHYHDLGKYLFAFIFFWGYIAFSQYLLIWYANVPEETGWYAVRQNGGWQWISLLLLLGHFLAPFFGLMSRSVRRNKTALASWAAFILVMHWVDLYWLVMPQLSAGDLPFGLIDICCTLGFCAVYVAGFVWIASLHRLVPLQDPRLPESLAFRNI